MFEYILQIVVWTLRVKMYRTLRGFGDSPLRLPRGFNRQELERIQRLGILGTALYPGNSV